MKKKRKAKKKIRGSYKIVRRNFGWYKRRFGILLDPLLPRQQELLINNKFLRDIIDEDQPLEVIFKIIEMEQQNKGSRKLWFNPYTDSVGNYKDIEVSSNYIDWNCAMCSTDIQSNMNDFSPTNFVCDDCEKVYLKKKIINNKIVLSSTKFTTHCKKLLKKDQRKYLVYVNRNRFRD